jgi:hypothetical protein
MKHFPGFFFGLNGQVARSEVLVPGTKGSLCRRKTRPVVREMVPRRRG